MAEANKENNSTTHPIDEQSEKHGLEDWEMVDQMSKSDGNIAVWFRYVVISFIVGVAAFILLAYSLHYFQMHYGSNFFDKNSGGPAASQTPLQ